jgi:hypothetical protein
MALQEFDKTMNYIQSLDDNPNISGLSAQALKARFDQAGEDIKTYINTILTKQIDTQINNINTRIDGFFPVGSIYMSVNNVNPSTIFGGTWEQIEDRFLLASGATYAAGTTGGESTVTLNVNQIPSHRHINDYYYPGGEQQWYTDSGDSIGGSGKKYIYLNGSAGFHGAQKHSNVGGGQAHNNMPPYLAVYVWKRVS